MENLALPTWPFAQSMDGDVVHYGPFGPDENTARLLGPLESKRVLVLGAAGATVVALAGAGARLTVAEPDEDVLRASQAACEQNDVTAEHLHGSLGELAAVRADSIDLTVAIYSLNTTAELSRVLRQVHRVLRPDAPIVASVPHPALDMVGHPTDDTVGHPTNDTVGHPTDDIVTDDIRLTRGYGDDRPRPWQLHDRQGSHHSRSIGQLFTELSRASLRVDTVVEAMSEAPGAEASGPNRAFWNPAMSSIPNTLLLRARKLGV